MIQKLGIDGFEIARISEDQIDASLYQQIAELRAECFPNDGEQLPYFKQIPHFRYVLFLNNRAIGQVGVDYRLMNFDGIVQKVYGLVSLCVTQKRRNCGLAGKLLEAVMADAEIAKVDLILLMADKPGLYEKHGFRFLNAECRWLGIDHINFRSVGMLVENIESEMMVKGVSRPCPDYQSIDYLGYMF